MSAKRLAEVIGGILLALFGIALFFAAYLIWTQYAITTSTSLEWRYGPEGYGLYEVTTTTYRPGGIIVSILLAFFGMASLFGSVVCILPSRGPEIKQDIRESLGNSSGWFASSYNRAIESFLKGKNVSKKTRKRFRKAAIDELNSKGLEGFLGVTCVQIVELHRKEDVEGLTRIIVPALERLWSERGVKSE